MGKYCLLKTPLKILVWLWNAEMSVLKWRNGDVYEKCTVCPCTYVNQPILRATTFTHIWEKGVVI